MVASCVALAHFFFFFFYDWPPSYQASECLGLAWSKEGKERNAPNVRAMIQRFNRESRWAATVVTRRKRLDDRLNALCRLLSLVQCLGASRWRCDGVAPHVVVVPLCPRNNISAWFYGFWRGAQMSSKTTPPSLP